MMRTYIGTKTIKASPMTRGDYNVLRGWECPDDENPADAGFLVEYVDGGKANHPDFAGYVSWSPADVFERAYKLADTWLDRLRIEQSELSERYGKLLDYLDSPAFDKLDSDAARLLRQQAAAMCSYGGILMQRIDAATEMETQ